MLHIDERNVLHSPVNKTRRFPSRSSGEGGVGEEFGVRGRPEQRYPRLDVLVEKIDG